MSASLPRVLTIAGSDSGGGAGIQADLKTFEAHGVYGTSALTAVTAQNTLGVVAAEVLSPELVAAQIDAVLDDIGADAVKVGMLGNEVVVRAVADRLRRWPDLPVVLDPVMVAKSGDPLLTDDAVAALREELLPLATLVTPNLPEAERLVGTTAGDEEGREDLGHDLAGRGPAALIKGGHVAGDEVVDLLVTPDGAVLRFTHPRIDTKSTHGTGCTLSSAIAARLARGDDLPTAVGGGIDYLQRALRAAVPIGGGHGPVRHGVESD